MENSELVAAFNDYGCQCKTNRKYLAAKQSFKQALEFDPTHPLVLANLGAIHHELYEYQDAIRCFEQGLKYNPEHPACCANYALLLTSIGEWDKAQEYYDKAIKGEPDHTLTQWDKGLCYLDQGNWEEGFKNYQVRFTHMAKDYPKYKFPIWNGEDLSNKTIAIYEEQGLGDKIMFSRFIYQLKIKYPTCKIYFLCTHQLQALLWGYQIDKICEFLPIGVVFPDDIDYGVYMLELPRLLGCTDPNNVPDDPGYILERCNFQKNVISLKTLIPGGKRIGLCWHGNPNHNQDHQRSIAFEKFIPLMDNPYYTWFSLQVDDHYKDIKKWGCEELINDSSEQILKDGLPRTGVTILNLDLVITIDTAVAHLAGVLDKPVWMLVASNNYWVWGREGKTSPWYQSMTIFRQETPGDWDSVINNVKCELDKARTTLSNEIHE